MPTAFELLSDANPSRLEDHDPAGPEAARALRTARQAPPPRRRRRPLLAIAGVAAASVAGVVAMGGGSSPLSPAAALAEVALRSDDIRSGVMHELHRLQGPLGNLDAYTETTVRFNPGEWAAASTSHQGDEVTQREDRYVGGSVYTHAVGEPWRKIAGEQPGVLPQIQAMIDSGRLIELLRSEPDLRYEELGDGAARFEATTTTKELAGAGFPMAWLFDETPATVVLEAGGGGLIRSVAARAEPAGPDRPAERRVRYEQLNEPQTIERPETQ